MRCVGCQQRSHMEPRRRNPLRRYPTAVCISVLHFGLTQSKTRALNSPGPAPARGLLIGIHCSGTSSETSLGCHSGYAPHGSRSVIMVHRPKAAIGTRAACVPASVVFRMLPKR